MRYGSVCSGIEAASIAWEGISGWDPAFFSEIAAFPRAVLEHHFPHVPRHGDFTSIGKDDYGSIELLVGGTPCQSFSVAGMRSGLGDDRGNLALEFLRLADRKRPRWVVWENVPGVLSSNGGRDFGSILGGMVELGYGIAYRILDAQYFGLAQRRRRVFVVGYFGDARRAAAVLFERASMSGHPAPLRKTGQVVALCLAARTGSGRNDPTAETYIAFSCKDSGNDAGDISPTLRAMNAKDGTPNGGGQVAIAFALRGREDGAVPEIHANGDSVGALRAASGGSSRDYLATSSVRRLTPIECERLQGFPDSYTDVPFRGKPASDSSRYKALGNSMAVPVMRWIGERIAIVDAISV